MSRRGTLVQFKDVAAKRRVDEIADVVIIGSGAAGATAAKVLVEAGAEVVVLEEGPSIQSHELQRDFYTLLKRAWRDMGTQIAIGRSLIPVLQGRCIGGSTAVNSAMLHRMPEDVHREWCEAYGVGDLLRYEDLERVWDKLDTELAASEAPEAVLGENNRLMRDGAKHLGMEGHVAIRSVDACRGSARCLFGCPTDRRQSMNVSYVPRAIAGGARVYATCRAYRVVARRGRAYAVEARFADPQTGTKGPTMVARARHAIICAASAIQSPLLLCASGLGRRTRLVGKRLSAHPGTAVIGVFDQPVNMWFGATQGYESTHHLARGLKFESLSLPPELMAVRLPSLGAEFVSDLANARHLAQWAVLVRARAEGTVRSRVTGTAAIHYDLTSGDVAMLKDGVRVLVEMMFAAGAREVIPSVHGLPDRIRSCDELRRLAHLPDDPRLFRCTISHVFGTAGMGASPATSVVAPDGQCHELPGLYVTDSSSFPTNLGVNPQHSICAVSWLAAERIAERIA